MIGSQSGRCASERTCRPPHHPAPKRGAEPREAGEVQVDADGCAGRPGRVGQLVVDNRRIGVERLIVRPQQVGGAGEGLGDTRAEGVLQNRQDPVADPGPRERLVSVGRVIPRGEPVGEAGVSGHRPADVQQRAPEQAVAARHARQRACAGAAGEPQQHRLGLVVEGMAEQHGARAQALGGAGQNGPAGVAGGSLRTR